MATLPADVITEALGEIGADEIGDIDDGSRASIRALRIYDTTLREMHAAAHWNFARRQIQLYLLADTQGLYATETVVPLPWQYMYEWPTDCVQMRFVFCAGVTAMDADGNPIGQLIAPFRQRPVPFIVSDYLRPNPIESSWDVIEGHSPESTRVVLTNELAATAVYTGIVQYPDMWPPLFRRAFSALLSARLAMSVVSDKKFAAQLRDTNQNIADKALIEARVRDGNEGWTIVDHEADWITYRSGGPEYGNETY